MILCLLGTNPYQFERLAKSFDNLCGDIKVKGMIQLGYTDCKLHNVESFSFCERNKLINLVEECEIVISQGGFGSMFDALIRQKPLIVTPRQVSRGECLDDQNELVDYWSKKGYLQKCNDVNKLTEYVDNIRSHKLKFTPYSKESDRLISNIVSEVVRK